MISRRSIAQAGASALLWGMAGQRSCDAAAKPHTKPQHAVKAVGPPPAPPAKPLPPIASAEPAALAAAQIDLASALILQGIPSGGGSIAVSPMSLAGALTVIAMGCDEDMRSSLGQAMRFQAPLSTPALQTLLGGFVDLAKLKAGNAAFPLTLANRLVIDPGVEPVPAFLQGLRGYGVDVDEADLANPAIVADLNGWVRQKTGNLVPSIISAPPGPGGLVALNALHFKDSWKVAFDPKETSPQRFTSADGKTQPVPMMRREGRFTFGRAPGFGAVDIGFGTDRFSLTLVTSTDHPATPAALLSAGKDWLSGSRLESEAGMISVPRFTLEHSADLLGPLAKLGLHNRPMPFFGSKPPTISAISQRSVFTVREEGAEAAAATAVAATRSLDDQFFKLTFDKPFCFALRDKTTGFVLLAGFVGRPEIAQS